MKIFEFNKGQSGTLIDSVSKTAGTLTAGNGGFRKTEKGLAMLFDGANTKIDTNLAHTDLDLTGNITIEAWIKPYSYGEGGIYVGGNIINNGKLVLWMREFTNTFTISSNYPTTSIHSGTISINKYLHLLITRTSSGVTNFYVDNSLSGSANQNSGTPESGANNLFIGNDSGASKSFDGCIAKVRIYDGILSTQERENLYQEFLQASPTEKEVRGFEYPKPTDLSYESGLVAAYSFSPETVSNGTLVDISGNGNNGTISGALLTKDGMKFDGVDDDITISSSSINTAITNKITLATRVKASDLTTYQIIGGLQRAAGARYLCSFNIDGGPWEFGFDIVANDVQKRLNSNGYIEGEVYTLIGTYDGSNVNFYINGILVDSDTLSGNVDDSDNLILCKDISNLRYLDGEIYDFKIYNYAFTPAQAKNYHLMWYNRSLQIRETFSDYAVGDII